MNNFTVATDGTAKTTVGNGNVSLGDGANSLLATEAALIVHASPGDMKTDPTGSAGAPIACAVILR
jgi:Cu/Zn superoxide dismutase